MINEKDKSISIVWNVEDVLNCIEDRNIELKDGKETLSDDECFEVLKFVDHGHDANDGINWDTIEWAIEYLYGGKG